MSHFHNDLAVAVLPRRDLASRDLWERSLERSLYRREQVALGRKQTARKKSASVAMSAAMLGVTASPSVAAAQSSLGGGSSTSSSEVQPAALEDPGASILLELGDSGPAVAAVQRELAIQVDPEVDVDGVFGPQTQGAVIQFQQRAGLRVDGVVGPETWDALFASRNVAFVPTAQPTTQAASYESPQAPTRPASDRRRTVGAQDFNGGNFLVMVGNKRSGGGSSATGGGSFAGGGSASGGNSLAGGGGGGYAGGVTVCGLEKLKKPVQGPITGTFGEDRGDHAHAGLDIAAPSGTPVKAAACGKITFAGVQDGYGKMVCIQHTPKFETCYAHLSSIRFDKGYVKTGQVIGRVGCTGTCTGPHVHWETRVRGNPKDPVLFLKGKKVPGKNKRYEREQRKKERQRERRAAQREQSTQEQQQQDNAQTVSTQDSSGTGSGTSSSGSTGTSSGTAPAYSEPAPAYSEPAPAYSEPAPAYSEPAPAYSEPAPVEPAPAPVEAAPVEPAPVTEAVEPAPVEPVAPAPAPVEPAPVEPAPVTEAVEPVPAPETTAPAPAPEVATPAPAEEAAAVTDPALEQSTGVVPEQNGEEVVTTP